MKRLNPIRPIGLLWGGIVNIFLAGNLLVSDRVPLFIVINHLAPWITLVSLLVFALAFTARRSRGLLVWLLPGVAAFLWWYAPAWLPRPSPDVDGIEFTAVTFNVLGHLADPDQTFATLQDINADIVGLQELRPTLQGKLAREYPYEVSKVVQGYDGLGLYSRFPILESEVIIEVDFAHIDLDQPKYIRAVVDIRGQPVVVYVIHPPIPQPSFPASPLYEVIFHYDDTHLQAHIERTVRQIKGETLPVLLLCDCNSTPRSRQYRLLDGVLNEAFGTQGWGLGLSHPVKPFPLLRIDYIWYSPDFAALSTKVWPRSGTSDHYPVWGRITLRRG